MQILGNKKAPQKGMRDLGDGDLAHLAQDVGRLGCWILVQEHGRRENDCHVDSQFDGLDNRVCKQRQNLVVEIHIEFMIGKKRFDEARFILNEFINGLTDVVHVLVEHNRNLFSELAD